MAVAIQDALQRESFCPHHLREKCILFVKLHLHREKVLKDFFIHSPVDSLNDSLTVFLSLG